MKFSDYVFCAVSVLFAFFISGGFNFNAEKCYNNVAQYPEPIEICKCGQKFLLEAGGDTQPVFMFDKEYGGVIPMPCPDKEGEEE